MSPLLGQFFALLTACAWAHNSVVYSFVGKRVSSPTTTHIRLWIALPAIIILNRLFTGSWFPVAADATALVYIGLSGLLGYCVADLFIFNSFVRIGPRNTMLIMTLSPVFSLVLSRIFLQEHLRPLHGAGIAVTLVGIAWVILEKENGKGSVKRDIGIGILFSVLGALFQAFGVILSKMGMLKGLHPVSTNLIRITAGLIGVVLFAVLRGQFFRDFTKMKDARTLGLLVSAALIGPVAGIVLSLSALKAASVGIVTTISQMTPVILLPVERLLFGRRITPRALVGTSIAVAGTALLFLY